MKKTVVFMMSILGLFFTCNNEELPRDQFKNDLIIINGTSPTIKDSAPFKLLNVNVREEILFVEVSYSGGCNEHVFELIWPEVITAVYPPDFKVTLNHKDNDDPCDAILTRTLEFPFSESGLNFSPQAISELRITVINGYDKTEQLSIK